MQKSEKNIVGQIWAHLSVPIMAMYLYICIVFVLLCSLRYYGVHLYIWGHLVYMCHLLVGTPSIGTHSTNVSIASKGTYMCSYRYP